MFRSQKLSILAIFATLFAFVAPLTAADAIKVAIKNVGSGMYLGRCDACVPNSTYPDNGFVHVKSLKGAHWAVYYLESMGKGVYAFKVSDTDKYLSRCNNCVPGGKYPDNTSFHKDHAGKWAQFQLKLLDNGHYTLTAVDSQKLLGRCDNCIPGAAYPSSAFVYGTKPSDPAFQWDIVVLP